MFNPQIEEIHWELTNHCNLQCVHCYLAEDTRRELSTQEILQILDQAESAGCLFITFSGGEPLLRKDFFEIYRYAHSKGFFLNIFTNGTKISKNFITLLKELPPHKVEITINGISEKIFEAVTSVAGSFQQCLKGIHDLYAANIPLILKTNGMTINYSEIISIKNYLSENFPKAGFKFDAAIMPRRNFDPSPTKLRLKPPQIVEIYRRDPDMQEQIRAACRDMDRAAPEAGKAFQCNAAKSRFHISAWGDLHPCHTVRPIRASLLEYSLSDAIARIRGIVDQIYYPRTSACSSCTLFAECDSCPGLAHLEQKNLLSPTPYHCEVAHTVIEEYG